MFSKPYSHFGVKMGSAQGLSVVKGKIKNQLTDISRKGFKSQIPAAAVV